MFSVCSFDVEYDDAHTGGKGADLGPGVRYVALEVREVVQLSKAFHLYELFRDRGMLFYAGGIFL